jgi:hypothetical protein
MSQLLERNYKIFTGSLELDCFHLRLNFSQNVMRFTFFHVYLSPIRGIITTTPTRLYSVVSETLLLRTQDQRDVQGRAGVRLEAGAGLD